MNSFKNKYPRQLFDANASLPKGDEMPVVFKEGYASRNTDHGATESYETVDFPSVENLNSLPGYVD